MLTATNLSVENLSPLKKYVGKVRDVYHFSDFVVIITTDRLSAFDRQLAPIEHKGRVLNLMSLWWFNQTKHIVPNHIIASPHPNIVVSKPCSVFLIEFVMRSYLTGSTSTSIWTHYMSGSRNYCGHKLPDGMRRNQKLEKPLLTPTTKDTVHDELISADEIISKGLMSESDFASCAGYAESLFEFSQRKCEAQGIIIVDTKYEFGKDSDGHILLIDEIQTPDSSRYWKHDSYDEKFAAGEEPENIDKVVSHLLLRKSAPLTTFLSLLIKKEFLRKWYRSACDPYKDDVLPDPPSELVNELSRRCISRLFSIRTN
jgi:phosphoribosylaminoimidazole-succinocarboxamide synthase